MSRGSGSSWASADDFVAFTLLLFAVGAGFGGYALWHGFHAEISRGFAVAAGAQLRFYALFTDAYARLGDELATADYASVTLAQIVAVANRIGAFLRWPAAAVIAAFGLACLTRAAPSRYTRKLDLEGLIKEHARSFPTLAAFVDRPLALVRPGSDAVLPADPALTAVEWIAIYATGRDGSFSEEGARAAFRAQLGSLWAGPEHAAPVVRVLFAVFSLHLMGKRKEAMGLLGDLSVGLKDASGDIPGRGPPKPLVVPTDVLRRADGIVADKALSTSASVATDAHGWSATALMSLLCKARLASGVLAPSSFVVVKLIDRPLWYALHSLGFPSEDPGQEIHPNPRVEAQGARAHWSAERRAGGPLLVPDVTAAIAAIRPPSVSPKSRS